MCILAQIREFTFSPNSGQIDSIKFDRFGLPALSSSVVSVSALAVQDVVRVEFARVLVRKSARTVRESDGIFEKATEALFTLKVRTPLELLSHCLNTNIAWIAGDDCAGLDRRGRI